MAMGAASRAPEVGLPALLVAAGPCLAPRWSGDPWLDRALAATGPRAAAVRLFGAPRVTRPVVRSLAASLLGTASPTDPGRPGRNADLLPVSVALGLDAAPPCSTAAEPAPGYLAPDDLAKVLAARVELATHVERAAGVALAHPPEVADPGPRDPLRRPARESLAVLVRGWDRRRRRDLGVAVVADRTGYARRFVRLLDEAADVAYLDAFDTPRTDLAGLVAFLERVLARYRVPSRRQPLEAARDWRGRDVIRLPADVEVRVPWNRWLLEAEARDFANCLGTYYHHVDLHGRLIATVRERGEPVAVAEIGPNGRLTELLGVEDAEVDLATRRRVVAALQAAEVLPEPPGPRRFTLTERISGRIACAAALLVRDEVEPELDAWEWCWGAREPGDATLELLGERSELLSAAEHAWLRADAAAAATGVAVAAPRAPSGSADGTNDEGSRRGSSPSSRWWLEPVAGWARVGVMLVAAGERDPLLVGLDGRAPFRRRARSVALRVLHDRYVPGTPLSTRDLGLLRHQAGLPDWGRAGLDDVRAQHTV